MISEAETWSVEKLLGTHSSQQRYHQSTSDHGAPGFHLLLWWATGPQVLYQEMPTAGKLKKNDRLDSAVRYTTMKQEQVMSWAQFCCSEAGLWWESSPHGLIQGLVLPTLLLQQRNPGRSRCLCGLGWGGNRASNTDGYLWKDLDVGYGIRAQKNVPFCVLLTHLKRCTCHSVQSNFC